jgi:hypothetical protein
LLQFPHATISFPFGAAGYSIRRKFSSTLDAAASLLAHVWYGRTGDINDAIEIGVNHRLEPLRAQLLERRNIADTRVSRCETAATSWPPKVVRC